MSPVLFHWYSVNIPLLSDEWIRWVLRSHLIGSRLLRMGGVCTLVPAPSIPLRRIMPIWLTWGVPWALLAVLKVVLMAGMAFAILEGFSEVICPWHLRGPPLPFGLPGIADALPSQSSIC